jgi:glycosyltransferase involved in cell wall biosynthesis
MAVAEALANGCRVVSYDLPVIRKEFGDAVVRVPCFDTDYFAQEVIKSLESGHKKNSNTQTIRTWEQASQEEFEIIIQQFAT